MTDFAETRPKPQIDDYWIVAIDNYSNRSIEQIDYITADYVHFVKNHLSVNKIHLDFVKKIELWDPE